MKQFTEVEFSKILTAVDGILEWYATPSTSDNKNKQIKWLNDAKEILIKKLSEPTTEQQTSDSNCIIPVVSESFTNVCRILLSKDVKIERDLDGFKKFVVNGEMCHSTKMVYKKLIS